MATGKGAAHPPAWSRFFRRLRRPFLTPEERARIAEVIAEAERATTGEIHVHVEGRAGSRDTVALASRKFVELGLDKTEGRNGVLILVFHLDHRFAIWGDEGIHAKAGRPLWERAREVLREGFRERRYAEGLEECVRAVGRELARHFPKGEGFGRNVPA